MKSFKNFSIGLIALMIVSMLLVACGDSPTATNAPAATTAAATTAAPTTAAATTAAPTTTAAATTAAATTAAPTTAAPTTAAPTTAAATTAAPTTAAAVAGALPVPTGTRTLKFSPGVTKTLIGQFATGAGTTNVVFESYVSGQTPVDLSKFYDQKMVDLGYSSHPETQASQQQGNVTFMSASFTKTNAAGKAEVTAIALVGPLDAAVISEIARFETASTVSPDMDVAKQLKAGDTLIMSFTFAAPATTVTATPAATAVASGTFPTPAGARALKLSAEGDKALFGSFGTTGTTSLTNVKVSTYVVSGRADKVSQYYDQAMTTIGYAAHPETNTGTVTNNVSFITQNYTKGTQDTFIMFVGPLDVQTITSMVTALKTAGATDDILTQLIIGDTIIRAVEGTLPATAVTVTVPPTKAPVASSPIPLPTGAKVLNLSDSLAAVFDGEFGDQIQNGKLTAYVVNKDPDSLASFFENQLPGLGYTLIPDSQTKSEQDGVSILTAGFAKGNDGVLVALFGPMDDATINDMATADLSSNPATSIKSQVKVGDTVIFVISGTVK